MARKQIFIKNPDFNRDFLCGYECSLHYHEYLVTKEGTRTDGFSPVRVFIVRRD